MVSDPGSTECGWDRYARARVILRFGLAAPSLPCPETRLTSLAQSTKCVPVPPEASNEVLSVDQIAPVRPDVLQKVTLVVANAVKLAWLVHGNNSWQTLTQCG